MTDTGYLPIRGVLFDLDGTLLDTAPDLIAAVNRALLETDVPPPLGTQLRPLISHGLDAMLRVCLPDAPPGPFESARRLALAHYGANLAHRTRLFSGMGEVLRELEQCGVPWGIVTNKMACFTQPLVDAFGLDKRAAALVSGDTTARRKPDPLPLTEACRRIDRPSDRCVYIGDAVTDIEAGRRAGMMTLAAAYGYLDVDYDPGTWRADGTISHPAELMAWLKPRIQMAPRCT